MTIASETPSQQQCALCHEPLQGPMIRDFNTDNHRLSCRACGIYEMTIQAFYSPLRGEEGTFWLGAATRQHWELYRKPLIIRMGDMEQLAEQHSKASVSENIQKLLNYFVRKSPRPSALVEFNTDYDFRVIDARDTKELEFYLNYLEERGLIECEEEGRHLQSLPTYYLTPGGWDNVLGTSASSVEHGRVFVAMWFHQSMNDAYETGIKTALRSLGYLPVCMNETLQNDDINFAILAEIRRAQFVIADITGARGVSTLKRDSRRPWEEMFSSPAGKTDFRKISTSIPNTFIIRRGKRRQISRKTCKRRSWRSKGRGRTASQ
jgi:hypothetical protein